MSDRTAPVRYDPRPKRREATDFVLGLSEDDMLALVPTQAGLANTACPNCKGGRPNLANWAWTPERPHEVRCEDCGEVFPGNPRYPDDRYESVEAPEGEHRYPYYHPPDNVRLFFRAKADYLSREFISDACLGLAERFHETGDEDCARRAGLILLRCSEVYPTYAHHYQYPGRKTQFAPWHQNRIPGVGAYRTTRWTGWAYMDVSQELVGAYDILRFWPGLRELGDGKAEARIVEDLLSEMVRFVIGFEEQYTNMSPGMWTDIVYASRVLDRPDWIREVLERMDRFVTTSFLHDGHWMETSPSYCAQTVSHLGLAARAFEGYDPKCAGADDVAEKLAKIRGVVDACEAVHRNTRFPNGTRPTINDTWAPKARREGIEPRETTESLLAPGLGLAVLGGGQAEEQIYAWLNFTSGRHHKHVDALSVGIFAFGKELLRDLGYTHSIGRSWATSLMCHNTVVVDGLNGLYDVDHQGHRLRTFVSDGQGFHLVEAESAVTYPDTVRRYRRTLVLVGSDSRDAYLLDVFQVHGGDRHDYLLHGSADEDSVVDLSGAELTPVSGTLMNEGTNFVYPTFETPGEGDFGQGTSGDYGFVHDLSAGAARERVVLDLRLAATPQMGTRSTVHFAGTAEAYLGMAPRIREAEGQGHRFHDYQAPVFCLRREGRDLESVFIAVHEPFNDGARAGDVQVESVPGGVLVTVEREGDRDYLVMGYDGAIDLEKTVPDGDLAFRGEYGLLRPGRNEAHLVEGEKIALGDLRAEGVSGWEGEVVGVDRGSAGDFGGTIEVKERIGAEETTAALTLEFEDGTVRGYNVDRIEQMETGSRIHVRENPGFRMHDDGVAFYTYPARTVSGGRVRYRLPNVVHRGSDLTRP